MSRKLKKIYHHFFVFFLCLVYLLATPSLIFANPYFFISGPSNIQNETSQEFEIRVNTDGDDIGALQTVMSFDPAYFTYTSGNINIIDSLCDMFTYPNPGTPDVINKITPYVTENRLVITCGIMSAGYNGSDGVVAKFTVNAIAEGETAFSFSDNYFSFLGTEIAPGAMASYYVTISEATTSATPTPTASGATPLATASSRPTPITTTTVLFGDVEFSDVSDNFTDLNDYASRMAALNAANGNSGTGTETSSGLGFTEKELEFIDQNDTIPAPPVDMTPRAKVIPHDIPEIELQEAQRNGEVMSVQSLRDLLIPGKSKADKTVVMINIISTLLFLIILAFVIIKMFINSRNTKVKSKYINELISGELSTLETKLEIVKEKDGKERFEQEFKQTVENILNNVEPKEIEKKVKAET